MSHAAWAKAQPGISARAKGVLRCLADYADPEGYCCVTVKVLEVETSANERTVQRGLSELRAAELLLATDRFFVFGGRRVPVYRLAIEKGPQNTRQRLAETRPPAAEAAPAPVDEAASTGDTAVTPSVDGCQDCHPTGDTGVTPRVTEVSPKEKVRKREVGVCGAGARGGGPVDGQARSGAAPETDFERAVRRWMAAAPERVSPMRVAVAWSVAVAGGVGEAELADAVTRYLTSAGEVARGRTKAMDRWLSERCFEAWLTKADEVCGLFAAERFPNEEIRAAVVAAAGEPFAVSYLDRARFEDGTIIPRTSFALAKLAEHGALWARLGVRLAAPGAAAAADGAAANNRDLVKG